MDDIVKKMSEVKIEENRGRSRLKKKERDVIRKYMKRYEIDEDLS